MALELAYQRAHHKVFKTRGKASFHLCQCGKPACDWALRHGLDMDDPANYDPMCRKCHLDYDRPNWQSEPGVGANISAAKKGIATVWGSQHGNSKLVEKDVIEIRALYAEGFGSQKTIGQLFGVSEDTIYKIVNRKAWKHV